MSTAIASASSHLISNATLIKQGAEAKVYSLLSLYPEPQIFWPESSSSTSSSSPSSSTTAGTTPVILKYRFPKQYRHPTLDSALTRSRLAFEARALTRCARAGVAVPRVLWVDEGGGVLGLEKVEGWSVREVLGGGAEGEIEVVEEEEEEQEGDAAEDVERLKLDDGDEDGLGQVESEGMIQLKRISVTQEHLMSSIGTALSRLHITTIIHGDLTTSNMMVRLTPGAAQPYEIVLIDFGLSSTAQVAENYAVDLYVLERAFASTHPQSEGLYAGVLESYARGMGEKRWQP
ncbi:kinase-like domain-containing protein, partial [Naematelia encephala]